MSKPFMNGLTILEAITKIFSRGGVPPRIVIDPTKGPSWSPTTGVITLPAMRTDDLTDRQQTQLRAFFWHESMGEFGHNTWWDHPAIKGNRQRHMLANGIGDGYLDLLILRERPGAGADIREQVMLDCEGLLADGPKVTMTVGLVACLARYLIEGVTTWRGIYAAIPHCAPLLDMVKTVLKDRHPLPTDKHVVTLTLALDKVLEKYKANQPEDQPTPEGDGGKGNGPKGPTEQKDGGKPTEGDGEGEGDSNTDISLDNEGEGSGDSESTEGEGKGEGDGEGEGEGKGSGDGEADGESDGESSGEGEANGDPSDSDGPGAETSSGSNPKPPRDLPMGEDSGDRLEKALTDMLNGQDGSGSGAARTFHESFRCVVDGKAIDTYLSRHNLMGSYLPDAKVKHDASVMLVRLRAALQGPSMRIERNQEYGRFDSRRAAAAIAGNRTVYLRRREIQADSVAVSVAWDESGSMDGPKITAVRRLVEVMGLALSQMADVATEFTGWETDIPPAEMPSAKQPDWALCHSGTAHTAGTTAVHRLYKSFTEGVRVLGPRLGNIAARGGTPMVDGFSFSAERLAARPENRKILFFLTDGQASGNDHSENAPWGYNALKYEVDRATASGVTVVVFGLGMDQSAARAKSMATIATSAGYLTEADRAAARKASAASYDRRDTLMVKPWGPNARVLMLPADHTVTQRVIDSLINVVAKQSRAKAS
jgi:cobalamin biosynthesis protein CobT